MFCTNCGANTADQDQFCPGCGRKLKQNGAKTAQPITQPAQITDQPSAEWAKPRQTTAPAKKRSGVKAIVLLMIFVAVALVVFAGCRGYLGSAFIPDDCDGGEGDGAVVSIGDATTVSTEQTATATDEAAITDEATVTTTTNTTTTTKAGTTTTTRRTTTTTANPKKAEADEIREMLLKYEWETTIEGFDAVITFKKDGTAKIVVTAPIFLFPIAKIDAEYSINDDCRAVILGEYNNTTYGISGTISKISAKELSVERDKDLGPLSLKAA